MGRLMNSPGAQCEMAGPEITFLHPQGVLSRGNRHLSPYSPTVITCPLTVLSLGLFPSTTASDDYSKANPSVLPQGRRLREPGV